MRDTLFVNWQRVNSGTVCLLESSFYVNHIGWLVGQSQTYKGHIQVNDPLYSVNDNGPSETVGYMIMYTANNFQFQYIA